MSVRTSFGRERRTRRCPRTDEPVICAVNGPISGFRASSASCQSGVGVRDGHATVNGVHIRLPPARVGATRTAPDPSSTGRSFASSSEEPGNRPAGNAKMRRASTGRPDVPTTPASAKVAVYGQLLRTRWGSGRRRSRNYGISESRRRGVVRRTAPSTGETYGIVPPDGVVAINLRRGSLRTVAASSSMPKSESPRWRCSRPRGPRSKGVVRQSNTSFARSSWTSKRVRRASLAD